MATREATLAQVRQLQQHKVAVWLTSKYPQAHALGTHMEPRYHQLEFEVRVSLTHLDTPGARLWEVAEVAAGWVTALKRVAVRKTVTAVQR